MQNILRFNFYGLAQVGIMETGRAIFPRIIKF